MPYLHISDVTPIELTSSIDTSGNLQIAYGAAMLSDNDDALLADHSDEQVTTIRIKLLDFTHVGDTWVMSATHGGNSWSSGSGHVYFDFGLLSDFVDVTVTATNTSTSQTKQKHLDIKTQPEGSMPATLHEFGRRPAL